MDKDSNTSALPCGSGPREPSPSVSALRASVPSAGKNSLTAIVCAHCGATALKATGGVNRSRRLGAPVFCSRACSGARRRVSRTEVEKKVLKAEYDRQRRADLGEALLSEKRAAYRDRLARDAEKVRAAQRALREKRREAHLEYIRRPEYRAWKQDYDRRHRAIKFFGPFAEAFLVLQDLEREIASRATRTEIYRENGILNKTQKRKRDYEKAVGC